MTAPARIGVPTEVKDQEYRVALTPAGARELTRNGHEVLLESGAGVGSGLPDEDYVAAGVRIVDNAEQAWDADLVLKVKEPVPSEFDLLRPGLVLFTYLHLAASRAVTDALLQSRVTAFGYETVQKSDGSLPLLAPMSEVAGRMATQVGASLLERPHGGRGILLGGVAGVPPGKVVVLGAGVAGMSAALIASGIRAEVTLINRGLARLRLAEQWLSPRVRTRASTQHVIEEEVLDADLVVGAVLVPGARAPRLISDELVSQMRPGSVLVDVSVDQGGSIEGSRPTTHDDPTIQVHGSTLYCVANMPGAVPHTSTHALTNATLPRAVSLADCGWRAASRADAALALGLNTFDGDIVHPGVAQAHGLPCRPLAQVLEEQ